MLKIILTDCKNLVVGIARGVFGFFMVFVIFACLPFYLIAEYIGKARIRARENDERLAESNNSK